MLWKFISKCNLEITGKETENFQAPIASCQSICIYNAPLAFNELFEVFHIIMLCFMSLWKNIASFSLPPTPPSSTSSDSEGSLSPERDAASPKLETGDEIGTRRLNQAGRVLLTAKPLSDSFGSGSSRHPINSPLISYQPVMSQQNYNLTIIIIIIKWLILLDQWKTL